MKKKIAFISGVILLLLVGTLGIFSYVEGESSSLGTINDSIISVNEVEAYARAYENQVSNSFAKEHGLSSYGEDFWLSEYDGEKPIDDLIETIEENIVYDQLVFDTAAELGIEKENAFSCQYDQWIQSDSSLTYQGYLANRISELTTNIKDKWLDTYTPTEDQLDLAYQNLDDSYKKSDYVVNAIKVKFFEGTVNDLETLVVEAPLSSDLSVHEEYWENLLPNAVISQINIVSQGLSKEDIYSISLGETLSELEEGSVIEYDNQEFLVLVSKEGGSLYTREESPNLASNKYINDLFEQKMTAAVLEADIQFSSRVKDAIIKLYQ